MAGGEDLTQPHHEPLLLRAHGTAPVTQEVEDGSISGIRQNPLSLLELSANPLDDEDADFEPAAQLNAQPLLIYFQALSFSHSVHYARIGWND